MSARDQQPATAGFVLVNALVIVAAIAAAASVLLLRAEDGRTRLVAMQEADALSLALDGFEALRITLLERDLQNGDVDGLDDAWARRLDEVTLARAQMTGSIWDAQGRFNLNWLADPEFTDAGAAWASLTAQIGLAPAKRDAVVAFLSPQGPENGAAFAGLSPPVSPLGGSILMLDQLASLPEITATDMELLRRHVAVLPGRTPINVNTASAEVLLATVPQLSRARVATVLRLRQQEPFAQIDDFLAAVGLTADPEAPDPVDVGRLSVNSDWFGGEATATVGTRAATRRTLFKRQPFPTGATVQWRVTRF